MNYTANDVAQHFQKYSDHISHYAVMHTKFRSANKSQKTLDRYVEQTNKNFHFALQVLKQKFMLVTSIVQSESLKYTSRCRSQQWKEHMKQLTMN